MATRDELYAKFGVTAEAAQLLETDLGTTLLAIEGMKHGWHLLPDPERAGEFYEKLNRKTLGQLLKSAKRHVQFDEDMVDIFNDGLAARNLLNHGFFERHNFDIQTDEGRDRMVADLERLHTRLFDAWQLATRFVDILTTALKASRHAGENGGPGGD